MPRDLLTSCEVPGRRTVGEWGADFAAVGVLVAATLAFHARLLASRAWMPEGGGDNAGFLLPLLRYAGGELRDGRLPLWNPHLYSGSPLAADIQAGLFYPANALSMLLVPRWTYGWMEALAAAHLLWAGIGLYVCARLWRAPPGRVARPAAVVGALAFMFSDVFVTHFGNLNLIAAASWLPWAVVAHRAALAAGDRGGALRWAVAAGVCLGLAGLAGHPQPTVYIAMALVVQLALHAGARLVPGRRAPSASSGARRAEEGAATDHRGAGPRAAAADLGRDVAVTGIAVLVGAGLAAVALVPAWELVQLTRRVALDSAAASAYALRHELLSGLLAPALFGRGMQRHWGPWPRVEVGHVGVVAVVLASVALAGYARAPGRGRRDGVPFLVALIVLGFALAVGNATPLYDIVREVVPGLGGMRAPARFVLLADFALALLAALGLDALLAAASAPRRRLAIEGAAGAAIVLGLLSLSGLRAAGELIPGRDDAEAVLAQSTASVALGIAALAAVPLLVVGWSRGHLGREAAVAAIVGLAFGELALAGAGLDWVDWDPTANHDPPAIEFLKSDPGLYRIEVRPEAWGWWSPSAAMLHDEDDVGGVYNPLNVAAYQLFWESLTDRSTPLYDFLNAKYVVAPRDFALPWDRFAPVFDADEHLAVFLNTAAAPRATLVHRAVVAADHDEAWALVRNPAFDPRAEVVIEGGVALEGSTPARTRADVTHYRSGVVEVATESPAESYLVLADVHYPGWRATVDGAAAPILRANYAFRAVHLPPGAHVVRFRFLPASLWLGAAVSLGTAVLAAVVLYRPRRRSSRKRADAEAT